LKQKITRKLVITALAFILLLVPALVLTGCGREQEPGLRLDFVSMNFHTGTQSGQPVVQYGFHMRAVLRTGEGTTYIRATDFQVIAVRPDGTQTFGVSLFNNHSAIGWSSPISNNSFTLNASCDLTGNPLGEQTQYFFVRADITFMVNQFQITKFILNHNGTQVAQFVPGTLTI